MYWIWEKNPVIFKCSTLFVHTKVPTQNLNIKSHLTFNLSNYPKISKWPNLFKTKWLSLPLHATIVMYKLQKIYEEHIMKMKISSIFPIFLPPPQSPAKLYTFCACPWETRSRQPNPMKPMKDDAMKAFLQLLRSRSVSGTPINPIINGNPLWQASHTIPISWGILTGVARGPIIGGVPGNPTESVTFH